ncbi:MAG: Uncharacterized protein JWN35_1878 [Frankiales bacterium]|nr:Uncharacterized protein [Frankiales bacterium]
MTVIPPPKAVRDLFADLLGRGVEINISSVKLVPDARALCCVSVYTTDKKQTGAVVVADLDLAARSGAALGLIPKGGAEAAVEDRELPANLAENFREVANIFAALFNVGDQPRLVLYSVHAPGAPIPEDVTALLRGVARREDYLIEIEGYGTGRLAVVLP